MIGLSIEQKFQQYLDICQKLIQLHKQKYIKEDKLFVITQSIKKKWKEK